VDRRWVASTLRYACGRWVNAEEFIEGVLAGLEVGREQYGEFAYRGRDNAKEGRYEARDAAAYALMEMADMQEAWNEGKVSGEALRAAQQCLDEVIVLAAQIDQRFADARRARLGGPGGEAPR
jgi:hypothetical protein